jgi:hypothetical protein
MWLLCFFPKRRQFARIRLLPPLSPAFRTRRLLALTLRDLRSFATVLDGSDHT